MRRLAFFLVIGFAAALLLDWILGESSTQEDSHASPSEARVAERSGEAPSLSLTSPTRSSRHDQRPQALVGPVASASLRAQPVSDQEREDPLLSLTPVLDRSWSQELDVLGRAHLAGPLRAWDARLHYMELSVDWNWISVLEALRWLERESGVPLEVSSAALAIATMATTRMRLKRVSLRNLVSLTLGVCEELEWEVTPAGIRVFHEDEALAETTLAQRVPTAPEIAELESPEWAQELNATLSQRRVTLTFSETPLREVMSFLRDIAGLNLTLAAEGVDQARVSVNLRDVTLGLALETLLTPLGLGFSLRDESIWIATQERVALNDVSEGAALRDDRWELEQASPHTQARVAGFTLPFRQALSRISEAAQAQLVFHEGADQSRALVTVSEGATVELACEQVCLASGAAWSIYRSEGTPPSYTLRFSGTTEHFYGGIEVHAGRVRAKAGGRVPALAGLGPARARLRELRLQRAPRDLAATRSLIKRVARAEADLARSILAAALAVDVLEAERGTPRSERVHNLAEVGSWATRPHCECNDPDEQELLRTSVVEEACLHVFHGVLVDLSVELGRGEAPALEDHPGRLFLSDAR